MGNTSPLDAKLARTFNFLPTPAAYFCSLYPRRDSFICKLPGQDKWRTWTGPLEDHQIIGVIADGGRGLLRGCHWGEQTRFAVLDIDEGSQYHNSEKVVAIAYDLAAVGLNISLYRSSENGGWHGYIPFADWAESSEVEQTLKRWLKALGYELKGGQLEVFPSGNALRLPLQPGFAWLDQEGNLIRTRDELALDEALTFFLSELEDKAGNWQEAKSRIESQLQAMAAAAGELAQERGERLKIEGFEHVYSAGKIQEIWNKGREWWWNGLQENGERHNAVLAVGHYLWYGDEERRVAALPGGRNDEYRAALIEQWLRDKNNGKCRHINEGNWGIVQEQIRRAVLWRRKTADQVREPYRLTDRLLKRLVALYRKTGKIWTIEEFEKANHDRRLEARARIAEAVVTLEDQGRLITIAEVARQAGSDWRTVKRHSDLLACSVGEYNLGGPGALVLSLVLPVTAEAAKVFEPVLCQSDSGCSVLGSESPDSLTVSFPDPGQEFEQTGSCSESLFVIPETNMPDLQPGGGAVLSPGSVFEDGSLTPCAEEEEGRRRTANGKQELGFLPPSFSLSLATGSSCGLGGLGNASGISSLALLAPVILGNFSMRAQVKPTPARVVVCRGGSSCPQTGARTTFRSIRAPPKTESNK